MSANQKTLLLRLRSLVADKEWTIACANMDLASAGVWSCDHKHQMQLTQADIDETLCQLEDAIRPEWTPVDELPGSVFELPKPFVAATVDQKTGSVVSIDDGINSWLQTR